MWRVYLETPTDRSNSFSIAFQTFNLLIYVVLRSVLMKVDADANDPLLSAQFSRATYLCFHLLHFLQSDAFIDTCVRPGRILEVIEVMQKGARIRSVRHAVGDAHVLYTKTMLKLLEIGHGGGGRCEMSGGREGKIVQVKNVVMDVPAIGRTDGVRSTLGSIFGERRHRGDGETSSQDKRDF